MVKSGMTKEPTDMGIIGQTVSHYTILEELGRGGAGVVYKARDTRLGRMVAIKFLSGNSPARGEERDRFIREAQSASALNHPNICTIHEIDEVEDELFIVMEFVGGHSLRKAIETGPLSVAETLRIGMNIVKGLQAAHRKMIVHRDIKPENIIITEDGVAKIVDFGLAREADQLSGSAVFTGSGTIAYMSPEQVRGDQVNQLTDIWSLGVVLYEMLTGRRPFVGEYDEAAIYAIGNQKQPPASTLRSDVPAMLEKVIDRCLEKSPHDRYADAAEVLNALRMVEHGPTGAAVSDTKSLAVLPFADISPEKDNKYFSDGLTEEIITNLSRLQKVKMVSRTSVMHYDRAGKSMKQIAAELGVQYVLEGSVRKHGSNLRITTQLVDAGQDVTLWAEIYDGTMDEIFDIQEKVAGQIVNGLSVQLTPDETRKLARRATKSTEAYQLYLKGRFFWSKRSLEGLRTAIRYFEEAIEKDPQYAEAWAGIADSYMLLIDHGSFSRKETYLKARAAVEVALGYDDQLAEAHASLAMLLRLDQLDWRNAEREFKLSISLDPNYATAHHWYGECLATQGRMKEAIDEISLAVELDPLSPAILKDKGMVLYYARDYDGAIEYARKAQELDADFPMAHRLLSLAYLGKGMFPEAIAENRLWGEQTGSGTDALIGHALCLASSGKGPEALETLQGLKPDELTQGNHFRAIALVYAALGEVDPALAWLEKGLEWRAEAMSTLKVDPKVDRLRGDPRFAALLKRVGFD
jgi:serine/threonine protein kinase/Tfp pilus assembly protein PilF